MHVIWLKSHKVACNTVLFIIIFYIFVKTIKQYEGKQNVLELPKVKTLKMIGNASIHTHLFITPPPLPITQIYMI